jgi:UDP-glucuronate 4-epimerase
MFMHVFITGGAGFIGSSLADKLLAEGHKVTAFDDFNAYYNPEFKRRNVRHAAAHQNYRLIEGDVCDRELVSRSMADPLPDVIVHLAARAGVRASLKDPFLYQRVNVEGTLNILESARVLGVPKLTFASTSSVYGKNSNFPFKESDPVLHPVSPYAATKIAGEALCHSYHHIYGLDIAVLRFFSVYGPRGRPDMAIYQFSERILAGKPIPVFGDGTSERDYTYIDDITQGVAATLHKKFGFEIFNLGESETTPLHQMISLLESALGKKAVIDRLPDQPGDVARTCASIEKSRRLLGYDPKTNIEAGLPRFVEWYLSEVQPHRNGAKVPST